MSWISIDMNHEDRRVTKLANYELAIALRNALGIKTKSERKRHRKVLVRKRLLEQELLAEGVITHDD